MINELIEQIGGRDRLEAIVYAMGAEPCDADPILDSVTHGDIGKMARALLSVMDAKPVGYFVNTLDDEGPGFGFMFKNDEGFPGSFPLYATPTAASEPVSKGCTLPDGMVIMPRKLTAENGAKHALSGEFFVETREECHECGGCGCEDCGEDGSLEVRLAIDWTTIKEIYSKTVEHFEAAPALGGDTE